MIKIFIPADTFLGWGGGVDFLRYYMGIINVLDNVRLTVSVPMDQCDQRLMRWAKNCIKILIGIPRCKPHQYGDIFSDYNNVHVTYYRRGSSRTELERETDIVFLAMNPVSNVDRHKVVGYIPDLQHIHLPQFFSENERLRRDESFKKLLCSAGTIFVNSRHTAKDIKQHYPEQSIGCEFFSMPFLPLNTNFLVDQVDLSTYDLPKRYFMISSQLWVHKDHPTAFRAMAELLKNEYYSDVELLCSGNTYDYRSPNYFNEIQTLVENLGIKNNVRFLGFIPKVDQLAILRRCVAVVQPTLFEGGPGGGATYEAVAYGVPAIISDIEINQEIEIPDVMLFVAGNSDDLAIKMTYVLENPIENPTIERLKTESAVRFKEAKKILSSFFEQYINNDE